MGIVEAIAAFFGAIKAIFSGLPFFDKWFTKTPTEKLDDVKEDLDKEEEEFKKDGRPKWD
jgi:hypothetical protein